MSDIAAQVWPVPRAGSGLAAAALACALGAACAFAVAGLAWERRAAEPHLAPPAAVSPAPAPAPLQWLEIIKPIQMFSLEAPLFRSASLTYSARRLVSGDAREDTLAYGVPAGDEPMLRLALMRGAMVETGLDAALRRLAARQRISFSLGARRGALTTRFGRFETATLRIPGRGGACDGFHLASVAAGLSVDGILCGTARSELACLIERLDLAAAGEDHALADVFASAELRRNPSCRSMQLAPDVAHAAWLDDKRATPTGKIRRPTGF